MKPTETTPASYQPGDLRRLVDKDRLLLLAQEAAQRANLSCFEACIGIHCPKVCPPVMVPLLLYCYAAGIYGSDEVAQLSCEDENLRVHCGGKGPESVQIQCFRRSHREMLRQCLLDLIRQLRRRLSQDSESPPGAATGLPADAFGPWTCEHEAEERFNRAARARPRSPALRITSGRHHRRWIR